MTTPPLVIVFDPLREAPQREAMLTATQVRIWLRVSIRQLHCMNLPAIRLGKRKGTKRSVA